MLRLTGGLSSVHSQRYFCGKASLATTISVSRSLRLSKQEEFTRIHAFVDFPFFLSLSFLRTRDTCVDVRGMNLGQKVAERKDKVKRDALFTCSGSL